MAGFTDRILVVIDATSAGATRELNDLQRSAAKTGDSFDSIGKKAGLAGSTIKAGLVAGAAAFIGTNLVSFLNDSVEAFSNAAKAAGDLADASGGTIREVSRMQAALEDAGISAEQSAGLLTKFTTNAQKNATLLSSLNVEMVKGKDGNTDYAATMVEAVDAVGKIGDASKRSQALVQLFGKQGAKAFQDLLASGMSLKDAMDQISESRVFDEDARRRAEEYDQAIDSLKASMVGMTNTVGQALTPIISSLAVAFTDVVEAMTPVVAFLADIPGPVYLTVGAFTALNVVLKSTFAANALSMIGTWAATTITSFVAVGTGAVTMSTVVSGAMKAMGAALIANPVGAVLAAVAAGLVAIQFASATAKDEVDEFLPKLKQLEDAGLTSAEALTKTSEEWAKSASLWDKIALEQENFGWLETAGGLLGFFKDAINGGSDAQENFRDKLQDTREEMGEFAFEAGIAQANQRELNDLLALGVTSGQEFSDAVREAGEAQAEQNATTELSKGLMDAYRDATYGAVDAQLALFDKTFAANDAQRQYNDAIATFNAGGFDSADDKASALDDVAEAAIRAAGATTAAQQQTDLLNGTFNDSAYYSNLMITSLQTLAQQPGLPAEAKANIEGFIGQLQTAQQKAADGVAIDVTQQGADAAKGEIDAAATDQDSQINVSLAGADEARATLDSLDDWRDMRLTIGLFGYTEAQAILDSLDDWRDTRLTVALYGDEEVRSQLDRLDDWRTVRISVETAGVNAARSAINSITGNAFAVPQQRIILPQQQPAAPAINMVKVIVDGNELRSVIRDELRTGTPAPQEVA